MNLNKITVMSIGELRALEDIITKTLSSKLQEVFVVGARVKIITSVRARPYPGGYSHNYDGHCGVIIDVHKGTSTHCVRTDGNAVLYFYNCELELVSEP
jgi:hypothetical protein